MNPDSPQGTISSIDHALRSLDRRADEEQHEIERQEKALADYRAQADKPFEHEARLRELQAKQAQLNAALDLDKHEAQTVAEVAAGQQEAIPSSFAVMNHLREPYAESHAQLKSAY